MDWLESGVFCMVRADYCSRNNGYSNRGKMFSVQSVPKCYKQDSVVQLSEVERVGL
jgi:hypothetical protein